jgi:hypothetical protein
MNIGVSLVLLVFVSTANPAELNPLTLRARQQYVQSASARMQEHLSPENRFLTIDDKRESLARVRSGEILVSPVASEGQKRAPSGLIHDWLSAVFIERAALSDIFSVIRNYDRYKVFYLRAWSIPESRQRWV